MYTWLLQHPVYTCTHQSRHTRCSSSREGHTHTAGILCFRWWWYRSSWEHIYCRCVRPRSPYMDTGLYRRHMCCCGTRVSRNRILGIFKRAEIMDTISDAPSEKPWWRFYDISPMSYSADFFLKVLKILARKKAGNFFKVIIKFREVLGLLRETLEVFAGETAGDFRG